ncbi:hypothetical protein CSB09_02120, partial [Candidatus Gracilibacteria bacterium]
YYDERKASVGASLFLPRILFLLSAKEKRKSEGFIAQKTVGQEVQETGRRSGIKCGMTRKSHPEERSDVAILVTGTEEIATLRFTALAMTGTKSPCPTGHPPLQRGHTKIPRLASLAFPLYKGGSKKISTL